MESEQNDDYRGEIKSCLTVSHWERKRQGGLRMASEDMFHCSVTPAWPCWQAKGAGLW